MNRPGDLVSELESWLAEDDGSPLPERVFDAVLADLPATVQSRRRAGRLLEAFRMTPLLRIAVGGGTLLAAGAVLLLIMRPATSVGPAPSPSGGASVSPTASARAFSPDPCMVLTNAKVSEILGKTVLGSIHLSGRALTGMRDCVFFPRNASQGWVGLSLRQTATSTAEARELAKQLFAGDFVESAVGSAEVFKGNCEAGGEPCRPATAVSVAPYFVVVEVPHEAIGTTPLDAYEVLVNAVIDSLGIR